MTDRVSRVLVIEDNPLSRELVFAVLESLGCDIVTAGSAEEGLELAESMELDLILLDLRLPGMSGYEAIRRDSRAPGAPVRASGRGDRAGDAGRRSQCVAGGIRRVPQQADRQPRLRELVRGYLRLPGPS